jgi:hypothetical protein
MTRKWPKIIITMVISDSKGSYCNVSLILNKQSNKQKQQHMHITLSCFIFTSVVLRAIVSIFTLLTLGE